MVHNCVYVSITVKVRKLLGNAVITVRTFLVCCCYSLHSIGVQTATHASISKGTKTNASLTVVSGLRQQYAKLVCGTQQIMKKKMKIINLFYIEMTNS